MEQKTLFDNLPFEIQEAMLDNQVAQCNPRNPEVFRRDILANIMDYGFSWSMSPQGKDIWHKIINEQDYSAFFKWQAVDIIKKITKHLSEEQLRELIDWITKTRLQQ